MFSLLIECSHAELDLLVAELWEAGVAGIVETPEGLRAFFPLDADRDALARQFGAAPEEADERDWVAESRQALQPMAVGHKFFLVPEWRNDPAPAGRIRMVVNSGLAFGTGAHESTQLCLEALENLVERGMTVVDIGTGSGILAEAARKLGAGRVIACDLDPLAVGVARENFMNAEIDIELFEGSIQQVSAAVADLTIGNISPEWLALLAPEWDRVTKPGGIVLLSGLEAQDLDHVLPRIEQTSLRLERTTQENSWRALCFRKPEQA